MSKQYGGVKHTEGKYVVYRLHYTKDLTHDHRRYHHDDLPHTRLTDYRFMFVLCLPFTFIRLYVWRSRSTQDGNHWSSKQCSVRIGCDYHCFKLVRLCASYFGVTTTLGLESLPCAVDFILLSARVLFA